MKTIHQFPQDIYPKPEPKPAKCPECGAKLLHTKAECNARLAESMRDYWRHLQGRSH